MLTDDKLSENDILSSSLHLASTSQIALTIFTHFGSEHEYLNICLRQAQYRKNISASLLMQYAYI